MPTVVLPVSQVKSAIPGMAISLGAIQGNMLVGADTLLSMEKSFLSTEDLPLAERILLALQSGQDAGGDKRGRQSAALQISHQEAYPYLDLRVDEHHDPIPELRRVYNVAQTSLIPLLAMLPTKKYPAGQFDLTNARERGLLQDGQ